MTCRSMSRLSGSIRNHTSSSPRCLQRAVLSFDLAADGSIVYSDGSSVRRRAPDGADTRLFSDRAIEQVVFLSS